MTTIKLKNGSGAPTAGDLAQGEPALDLTNKRLYTEDSLGAVIEVGTNPGVDVTFADNRKAIFGAGSDLQIYHDGSHSIIQDSGAGDLILQGGNDLILRETDGTTEYLRANEGAGVQVFHNGSQKLLTTSTGVDVTGTVVADGIESSGDLSFTAADGMEISAKESLVITIDDDDNDSNRAFVVRSGATGSIETLINASEDAGVTLYYDNAAKLATTSTGIDVTGSVTADSATIEGGLTVSSTFPTITFTDTDSNPDYQLRSANGYFQVYDSTNAAPRFLVGGNGDISFYEDTGTTAKLFWDASAESLGIGTSSPSEKLHVSGALRVSNNSADTYLGLGSNSDNYISTASGGSTIFRELSAERMRIDSSGNLLVGKTSASSAVHGGEIRATGQVVASVDGSWAGLFNRETDDGEIVRFKKDDTTVGSIGVEGGDLVIGTGTNCGLQFNDGNTAIRPFNIAGNAPIDNAVDLGVSGTRFKDLYLSGGAYLGGTGSANKLDDYEEGTWTPTFGGSDTDPTVTYASQDGVYTKIGNLVTVTGLLGISANSGGVGSIEIKGLPFTQKNSAAYRARDAISGFNINLTNGAYQLAVEGVQNATRFLLLESVDAGTWSNVQWTQATASSIYVAFTAQYYV